MPALDLAAYFARIGLSSSPSPDVAGLAAMQRAHRLAIPFENLDVILGRGVSLVPDAVFAKLVTRRRGGYCFEQNQLFLRALRALGFVARPLLARVWVAAKAGEVPPRTHTFNLVTLGGREWVADAGFGANYAPPLPLEVDSEAETDDGARHRLRTDPTYGWRVERRVPGEDWLLQYSFTTDRIFASDLAMANHWTANAPDSRFTKMRIMSRVLPDGLVSLSDRRLSYQRIGGREEREVESAAAYRAALASLFDIDFDADEVRQLGLFDQAA